MDAPYLRLHGISKRFPGVVALNRAELDVRAGEAVALMGANGAGKSTLMNILGGVVGMDEGEILIGDAPIALRSPIDSIRHGIAFVHQELNSLPTMTIAENVFIDAFPQRHGRIDFVECRRRTAEILARLGSSLDPRQPMAELSIGDRQLVEVARALRRNPKILIFDEPTSSLSLRERERLFDVVRALKSDGVAIIYITHFVDEIFAVCDSVSVMRNGATVFTGAITKVTPREIVHHMMGTAENERPLVANRPQRTETLLEVEGLTRAGVLEEINLSLKAGEIVGLWGLLGAGRTELLRALAGLDPIDGGTLGWREGRNLIPISPRQLQQRAGFVTEDRRGEGLLLPLSAGDNIVLPSLGTISRLGFIIRREQKRIAAAMIRQLGIKVTGEDQRAATLSGGNQQKVVFARWLATAPKLFLLDEPTRGLDVGAKTEILKLVSELADAGTAVLMVSSEIEELTRVCDRYLVMARGRIIAELPGSARQSELLAAVSGLPERQAAA
ncbi:sugar ABC transporter ATP-binding protein (plasmid) [Mesorhizobium sp. AR02]|uniref:sugar ABC transporter ATP-binding protein n=1 Tax=Mesorhizobium sp. AR02 TaxID=2865837 RepID=UPI00215F6BC9|nr:sugar ABC transporter ATP-binding protein [Mesorhizobium sp. AR02]UVK57308.1 sugar ABC transporter ATP-binding protein [Mesorhizobium sp. AR02]